MVKSEGAKQRTQDRRVPSLDGLRGVAILLMVLGHSTQTTGFPQALYWFPLLRIGSLGLAIFFTISGFIITWLLLKERQRSGRISLRAFYVRRALRIVPALWLVMALGVLLQLTGQIAGGSAKQWFASFVFLTNFVPHPGWFTAHTWSLAVEEQFYLLWPFLLAVVLLPRGWALTALLAWLVFCMPMNGIGHVVFAGLKPWYYSLPYNSPYLAAGCALALWVHQYPERAARAWAWHSLPVTLLACALPLLIHIKLNFFEWERFTMPFGGVLSAVSLAYLIGTMVFHRRGLGYAFLNARWLVYIGTISYSTYLWQQFFTARPEQYLSPVMGLLGSFPLSILVPIALGSLGYHLVEKPCQQMRHRVGKPALAAPASTAPLKAP